MVQYRLLSAGVGVGLCRDNENVYVRGAVVAVGNVERSCCDMGVDCPEGCDCNVEAERGG
jgi:hypothetical protein